MRAICVHGLDRLVRRHLGHQAGRSSPGTIRSREFPFLSVGLTYMPIPIGGFITLLFIIEQVWIGPPGEGSFVHREPVSAD